MRRVLALALAFAWAGPAAAAIHTEAVEYRHGDAVLEGCLAYDDQPWDEMRSLLAEVFAAD